MFVTSKDQKSVHNCPFSRRISFIKLNETLVLNENDCCTKMPPFTVFKNLLTKKKTVSENACANYKLLHFVMSKKLCYTFICNYNVYCYIYKL